MSAGPDLDLVAAVYASALAEGRHPTMAVADHFGRPRSTVGRWVMRARDRGLLSPVRQGEWAGMRNPKALAIAVALGVTYEALVKAVYEHADGDLRLNQR